MTSLTQNRPLSKRQAQDDEAYLRGSRVKPNSNDSPVIIQLVNRGIPLADITTFGPGQNVRTYRAWRSIGRQVRKGERSVRCTVWLSVEKPDKRNPEKTKVVSYPKTACVFHVSQTDEIGGAA